mmetsp:Transcript_35496/g.79657  ORF Transcript_35496/g.79657 Transcript_35496/m.79657 type:complete len:285 (+) Transcript_35496:1051-1905(+)
MGDDIDPPDKHGAPRGGRRGDVRGRLAASVEPPVPEPGGAGGVRVPEEVPEEPRDNHVEEHARQREGAAAELGRAAHLDLRLRGRRRRRRFPGEEEPHRHAPERVEVDPCRARHGGTRRRPDHIRPGVRDTRRAGAAVPAGRRRRRRRRRPARLAPFRALRRPGQHAASVRVGPARRPEHESAGEPGEALGHTRRGDGPARRVDEAQGPGGEPEPGQGRRGRSRGRPPVSRPDAERRSHALVAAAPWPVSDARRPEERGQGQGPDDAAGDYQQALLPLGGGGRT